MPPIIKTRSIEVKEEFVELMIQTYSNWVSLIAKSFKDKRVQDRYGMAVSRLLPIIRRQSPGLRSGLDYEISRLRGLQYENFETHEHNGMWLAGNTNHVTCREWRSKRVMAEFGKYWVGVPVSFVGSANLSMIHMIPQRNPRSLRRHPHHYINNISDENGDWHPLDGRTGNCYGSYAGVIKGLLDEPDIPELFRQLRNHLGTYGDRPPMRLSMDFDITGAA